MKSTNSIRVYRAQQPSETDGKQLLRNSDFYEPIEKLNPANEDYGKWLYSKGGGKDCTFSSSRREMEIQAVDANCHLVQYVELSNPREITFSCNVKATGEGEGADYPKIALWAGVTNPSSGRTMWNAVKTLPDGSELSSADSNIGVVSSDDYNAENVVKTLGFSRLNTYDTNLIRLFISVPKGYRVKIKYPKLERGTKATAWSMHPDDSLQQRVELLADDEGGRFETGVVLSRLLSVGQNDSEGKFQIKAGVSGITRLSGDVAPNSDSPIAFWAGGKPIDAVALKSNGKPVPADAATMVQRHDGTGYWCNGDVRFQSKRLEIGDSITLDAYELAMCDGVNKRMRVSNKTIAEFTKDLYRTFCPRLEEYCTLWINNAGVECRQHVAVSMGFGGDAIASDRKITFNGGTIEVKIPKEFKNYPDVEIPPTLTRATVRLLRNGMAIDSVGVDCNLELNASRNAWCGTLGSFSYRTINEGVYTVVIELADAGEMLSNPDECTAEIITSGCDGKVETAYLRETIIANNGFMTAWGTTQILAEEGRISMSVADKGIEITAEGVKINGKLIQ